MAHWLQLLSFIAALHFCLAQDPSTFLRFTAIVGIDGLSAFQCWGVQPPFTVSQQPGTIGATRFQLGNSTGSTVLWFNATAPTEAGLHHAPASQWVFIIQGSGVVTLPNNNHTLALPSGSIIIANDTAEVSQIGHDTRWTPGSAVIQAPFTDQAIPGHIVLDNSNPCPQPNKDD